MIYSFLALLSGVNVAISIMLNARLGAIKGLYKGAFINYFMGFCITIPLYLIIAGFTLPTFSISLPEIFILTGGSIGYLVVLINNNITPKIGILYVTILLFIGQIATGALMDIFAGDSISAGKLIGALLILAGLVYLVKVENK
ncbi:MAG: DMT family transporter [Clostridia bacterium]|nr:DMT family transporter [Clostridia bacterium]MBN2882304.1 DMT family transporter [Clostridia bacterium]